MIPGAAASEAQRSCHPSPPASGPATGMTLRPAGKPDVHVRAARRVGHGAAAGLGEGGADRAPSPTLTPDPVRKQGREARQGPSWRASGVRQSDRSTSRAQRRTMRAVLAAGVAPASIKLWRPFAHEAGSHRKLRSRFIGRTCPGPRRSVDPAISVRVHQQAQLLACENKTKRQPRGLDIDSVHAGEDARSCQQRAVWLSQLHAIKCRA